MENFDGVSVKPAGRMIYVLTIWPEDKLEEKGASAWRMHLVDPVSNEKHGFTKLEALCQFLSVRLELAE